MERLKNMAYRDLALKSITKPTQYQYLRLLRSNLWFINVWPSKELGEFYPKYYMYPFSFLHMVLSICCIIFGTKYIVKNSDKLTFYELGATYITWLMNIVETSRTIFTLPQSKQYRDVTTTFLTKIHLFFYKDVSDYAMKMHKEIHVISHIFTVYLTVLMLFALSLFNLIPMWNNYSKGKFADKTILVNTTYEHSLYFDFPHVYTHFDAYVLNCILNWVISLICAIMFCMVDLLLSLMVFNLWGHLKILLHDLASFPLPAKKSVLSIGDTSTTVSAEMYSEEELIKVTQKLKECIDYHRLISDFTNNMSGAFGPVLFIYLIFHQVSGCLLLLECSQMTVEALMRYLPLSIILFQQLIQLSVVFELIGTTSDKLMDGVYGVPWQFMDAKNRKTVAIFLIIVQKPIHVKALGVINIGVTSMAAILKTSMSYFTFLRSM